MLSHPHYRHITLHIHGKVQGVCFRKYTWKLGQELGLCGFVQNEEGASVLVEAEGEEDALQKLVNWCHHGPEGANVDHVEIEEGETKNLSSFFIVGKHYD